jgi:hypothetical protein
MWVKMSLKGLARIADKLQAFAFHKVDQFDLRVVMVNEPEPARAHVLPEDGAIILEGHFFECRDRGEWRCRWLLHAHVGSFCALRLVRSTGEWPITGHLHSNR